MGQSWEANALAQYAALWKKVQNIKGVGVCRVQHSPDGILIYVDLPGKRPQDTALPSFFQVIVKQNGGSNGDSSTVASWTYDLYFPNDTSYSNQLNDDPVSPMRSAARIINGTVNQADDGSTAIAYFDTNGDIQLWDCIETRTKFACS